MQKKAYRAPSMAEFGSIVQLTKGSGSSDKWDMGSGYKDGCGGGGEGGGQDQQC